MNERTAVEPQTALITIDPLSYVSEVYKPFQQRLTDAIAASKDVAYDITTKPGMDVAKTNRAIFRDIRIEGEKARAARKAPILEIGKLLDSKYKEIASLVEPHETRFDTDIKAEERRLDDEKAEKIKAEAERQAKLQAKIDSIKNAPLAAINMSSEDALGVMGALELIVTTSDEFGERFVEAEVALESSIAQLKTMIDGKRALEVLAIQQEAQRLNLERQARVQAEERAVADAKARQEHAAEACRIKEERAEIDRQRAELERQQQEIDHEKAERERIQKDEEAKAEAKVRAEHEAKAEAEHKATAPAESVSESVKLAEVPKQSAPAAQVAPNQVQPTRPSDEKIIAVLCLHFGVSEQTVRSWMADMKLQAAA